MCGLVGLFNVSSPFPNLFEALHYLQHRGDEGCGAIFSDGSKFIEPSPHRILGLANHCKESWPNREPEQALVAVGHVRYSTAGKKTVLENVQPLLVASRHGDFCIAHNGDIPGFEEKRLLLQESGVHFSASSDTEVVAQLIAQKNAHSFKEAVLQTLSELQGAFSFIIGTPDALIAARDPWGYRPLMMGKLGDGYVFVSETCALDVIHAKFMREIEPGELVWVDASGITSHTYGAVPEKQQCVFELIYFSRPDCFAFGRHVDNFREALGRKLAEEYGPPRHENAVVFGVPDSATFIAQGYAKATGAETDIPLIRNHYLHQDRTFIQPTDAGREEGVRLKFNPIPNRIRDRWLYIFDDSIVRGRTSRRLIRMFREHGARGITMMIASPMIMHPCRYGIDMKTYDELMAALCDGDADRIRTFIEADELHYLSMQGLRAVVGDAQNFCFACFNGRYAV